MSDPTPMPTSTENEAEENADAGDVYAAVGSVNTQLEAIEKFIARRFDEISMEINASSQQMEMAEEGITGRFGEILGILHAISFSGDGKTAANTGVELDAVVQMAEEAAHKILDSSDKIMEILDPVDSRWSDVDKRKETLEFIEAEISNIMMACSFQDITGQRINKTLDNLKAIEDRLGNALSQMGIEVEATAPEVAEAEDVSADMREGASQDDIDKLFDD